jgi:glycosyltransferase involved in cell wall biosynthesis
MKVAIYSISKNEEKFIKRWAESAKDADMILLADTGSTDNTILTAQDCGVRVVSISVTPWRFDNARNENLSFIPEDYDYCIALDCDEVLMPGWREALEEAYSKGVTRPRYKYVWSWNEDGSEGLTYGGDKIHARKDYVWKHPVHEVLKCTSTETQAWFDGIEIHHHPDSSKPRSQYLPLLKLSVEEDPLDDRNAFYYARELFFNKRFDEAKSEFRRHLSLPTALWPAERARSMRYLAELEDSEAWLFKALAEAPERREGWVDLAKYYYTRSAWEGCLWASQRALQIKVKPLEYLCEEFAWGFAAYDYAAIAAYHLGLRDVAVKYGEEALLLAPNDDRLKNNLVYYKEASNGN